MADIIGREKVCRYIERTGKSKMKIKRRSEGLSGTPCLLSDNPVTDFDDWADSFGDSTEEYFILLYDLEEKPVEKKVAGGKTKKWDAKYQKDMITATFALNKRPSSTSVGQPQYNGNGKVLTEERVVELLKLNAQPKDESSKYLDVIMKLKDDNHKQQMTALERHIEYMQKDTAKHLSSLRQDMFDMLEEEEEDRAAAAEEDVAVRMEKAKMDGVKQIAGIIQGAIPEVKEIIYTIAGKAAPEAAKKGLLKVAGPTMAVAEEKTFKIPEEAEAGKQKPYQEIDFKTATDEQKKAFDLDQQKKMQYYAWQLYKESNAYMGDDLMLFYKLSIEAPAEYANAINKIRQQYGYA